SVWLAWFLVRILEDFSELCSLQKDPDCAMRYRKCAKAFKNAIERNAWDGQWYLRAFNDDGTTLGSKQNDECSIDSIPQTWSVLANGAGDQHSRMAMDSVAKNLIDPEHGLILLFTPAFDHVQHDPGYIKGYPPGIRENGGHYSHAAAWVASAFAKMGVGDQAVKILGMLNPIARSSTREKAELFKLEPYVTAADIYSNPQHVGRGGWSWYTGSAAWVYRVWLEQVLGLRLQGDHFAVNPCIPAGWKEFTMRLKKKNTLYEIRVENPEGVSQGISELTIDGTRAEGLKVPLVGDQRTVKVQILLGGEKNKAR
ncbi:MAG TPA: glycosyl transferase, partial [Acidobacteriota bacterium]|nr:glycosyl transferase [Acidobacteriota bacterium]